VIGSPFLAGRDRYERVMEGWVDNTHERAFTHSVRITDPDGGVEVSLVCTPSPGYEVQSVTAHALAGTDPDIPVALAGLAGTLFAFSKGSLSPDTLGIPRSVDALVMVLLGGVETLTGPVVGAALFTLLQEWITRATPYWHAVLGASVVALTVLFPQGVVGTARQRFASHQRVR